MYNAFSDEKQERKKFEKHVKNVLNDEKVKIDLKVASLNDTLTSDIDTRLKSLEDKVLHSVLGLNDSITSITELTRSVKHNENSITVLNLEIKEQNTTLLHHAAMLGSFSDAFVEVQTSLEAFNDSCQHKGNVNII